ncbi:tandem-95 repeat protein [Paenibacillus chartarius]|uniref:Tandem-95 repeat protein n=1 Tax=Paenibacillus chartarius TaxID=747481 RepID=A0ABV6DN24_9BACL
MLKKKVNQLFTVMLLCMTAWMVQPAVSYAVTTTVNDEVMTYRDISGVWPSGYDGSYYFGYLANSDIQKETAAVRFNLPDVSGSITAAYIKINVTGVLTSGGTPAIKVYKATDDSWSSGLPSTIGGNTWTPTTTILTAPPNGWYTIPINVGSFVNAELAGDRKVSFVLDGHDSNPLGNNGQSDIGFNDAQLELTINMNTAPVASNGTLAVTEDMVESGTLSATDVENDALTYSVVVQGTKGTVSITNPATGAYTYTPNPNVEGADSFTFKATDANNAASNIATVNVAIAGVNDIPTISSIAAQSMDEDTATGSILFTVADVETAAGSLSVTAASDNQTLAPDANLVLGGGGTNRTLTVTPAANQSGTANITVTVTDANSGTATKTFVLTVNAVNDAPAAANGTLAVTEDTPQNGTLSASDVENEALTYSVVAQGSKGIVTITNAATGAYTYTPNPDAEGSDSFTFQATDTGNAVSNTATITVTITGVNDAPTAISDTLQVIEDTVATGTLTATDKENNGLTYGIAAAATKGTVAITDAGTGAYTYTPNADAIGADSFTFFVQDSEGLDSNTATITVNIQARNDAPVISDITKGSNEDTPIAFTVTDFVSHYNDVETEALRGVRIIVTGSGLNGLLTVNGAEVASGQQIDAADLDQLVFTPKANWFGTSSFTWKASDGTNDSNEATVTMIIASVNDIPVAEDKTINITIDGQKEDVLIASDADGDPLTYSIFKAPDKGNVMLSVYSNNQFTYQHTDGTVGSDSFIYQVRDNNGASVTASVYLNIVPAGSADLASLSASAGALIPEFDQTIDSYTMSVGNFVASTTVTAAVYNRHATLAINGVPATNGEPSAIIGLQVGANTIPIEVTSQSGAKKTYTLTITRAPSSSANLKALRLSEGVLEPEFDPGIQVYQANVGTNVNAITVTAEVYEPNAKIYVNNNLVSSGAPSPGIILVEGLNTITVKVIAQDEVTSKIYTLSVNRQHDNSMEDSGGSSSTEDNTTIKKLQVIVDGLVQEESATASTSVEGELSVTTITVDNEKVLARINREDNKTLAIPYPDPTDVVIAELNGQLVKAMEGKDIMVEVITERATYKLPAALINIDSVSEKLGQKTALQDIKISIRISDSSKESVKSVQDAADKGKLTVVTRPVDFEVQAQYGDKKVSVSQFDSYVERSIPLPEGINPSRITTGVVLGSDGSIKHVPTNITKLNDHYYANIKSLTNSTYSVIWNPKTFNDVEQHWSKDDVNDMGSRLIIQGISDAEFAPEQAITRAEFAAIVGRGLGLSKEQGSSAVSFKDVAASDWYNEAVKNVSSYGLVNGYEDGTFQPNRTITRVEAMAILARAMKLAGLSTIQDSEEAAAVVDSFRDSQQIGAWARQAVASVVVRGVVQGYNNELAPSDQITRAQTAAMVRRLLQHSELINR